MTELLNVLSTSIPHGIDHPECNQLNRLAQDMAVAHQRRWPGRSASFMSRSWLLASSPGLRLMLSFRLSCWLNAKRACGGWRARLWRLLSISLTAPKWIIQINSKIDIPHDNEIDGGVCLSDQGNIIFGAIKTGTGTVIGPRVTVGMGKFDKGRPEIGRNVWIASDCVMYGAIRVGDGATLMPGTVLTKSIPAGVVMQGNPARLVLRNFDNAVLRASPSVDALQYIQPRPEA